MAGVAHVSFAGGGVFLPDHDQHDRQDLLDYVTRLVSSKPKVQILLRNQRWLAESGRYCLCTSCGRASKVSCRETGDVDAYCVQCALGLGPQEGAARSQPATVAHLTLGLAQG